MIYGEMVDFRKCNKMIKISGKVDDFSTYFYQINIHA